MSEAAQNNPNWHKIAFLLLGVFLGLFVTQIAYRDSTPDFLQDGPLIVENRSNRVLSDLALISDRGFLQVGPVSPGQTIVDQRAIALGDIDYHLVYVLDGVPYLTEHLYNNAGQTEFRLYHRFELADDGTARWIVENVNDPIVGNVTREAQFDATAPLSCCKPKIPPSFLRK